MSIFDYGAFGEDPEAYTDGYGFDSGSVNDSYTEGYGLDSNLFDYNNLSVAEQDKLAESLKLVQDAQADPSAGFSPRFDVLNFDQKLPFLEQVKDIATTLGLAKDGQYDWKKILGLGGAGLALYEGLNRKEVPVKSVRELVAGLPSNTPQVTLPTMGPLSAGTQLQRAYAANMPSPLASGVRGYSEGGEVGPLSHIGLVVGSDGGQEDTIEARLSPGEYVFDAESVSMLGDGNNEAGARKLDELRAAVREHKRSASPDSIGPKAHGPLTYLKG